MVVDAAGGNAYLGFILYELFFKSSEKGSLFSVDTRDELTLRARERAQKLGFNRMDFQTSKITEAKLPDRVHLLVALHACDTATDDALSLAVQHNADHVALVPCCQAEVAEQLKRGEAASGAMAALFEHPWHRREFGSHLTNVIRALARGLRLPGDGDRIHRLGALAEKRAHPRPAGAQGEPSRPGEAQGAARRDRRRPPARSLAGTRLNLEIGRNRPKSETGMRGKVEFAPRSM